MDAAHSDIDWTNTISYIKQYDNPMPTWFLAPIAGLKLPTQDPITGILLGDLDLFDHYIAPSLAS